MKLLLIIISVILLTLIGCSRECSDLYCPAYSKVMLPSPATVDQLNQYDYLYQQMDLKDRVDFLYRVLKDLPTQQNETPSNL